MKKRSPVSRKRSLPDSPAHPRKPLLDHSRTKNPHPRKEIPLFRVPDIEADRVLLRKMADDFLENGTIPSAFTSEELEVRINESGIVPEEDEALWNNLARLVEVLREVKRGK